MSPNAKHRRSNRWALVVLVGILAIVGLEGYALSQGINGKALSGAVAAISALTGVGASQWFK